MIPALNPKINIEEGANMNSKNDLVEEFSKRWWYSMPEWPPKDFDYKYKISSDLFL